MHLEQVLIEAATTQGIWVLLFVSLFLYTIKNNEKLVEKQDKREENYQKLLSDMTENTQLLKISETAWMKFRKKSKCFRQNKKYRKKIVLYGIKSLII